MSVEMVVAILQLASSIASLAAAVLALGKEVRGSDATKDSDRR